jgi:predicted nuclease of predicted toxin-antitoxin system
MQFKLDENLPPSAAELRRGLGHDLMTVSDQGLKSYTDPEVLAACQAESKVLSSLIVEKSSDPLSGIARRIAQSNSEC